MRFLWVLVWSSILQVWGQAFGADPGITYYGRMIDPNGNAVISSSVQFRLQIRTPGNENCLLYEEGQSKDLSQTDGIFSVALGDGTGSRLDSTGFNLNQVFGNKGTYTFATGQCTTGTSWSPNPTDGRRIQVYFNDGTFAAGTWEQLPPVPINFIPMAIEAMQVGGYRKEQLLKLADGVPTTGSELNSASWAELLALLNGTTTQYLKPGSSTFTAAPTWSGIPSGANDLVNKTYVDAQVAAGLPNTGTSGTYTKVTTDAKGRVTNGSALVEADIPTLSTAGKINGSALNAGTIGGSTAINSTGNLVTSGTVQGAVVAATNLQVFNGANYLQLVAPPLVGNVTLTLPSADGAAGTLMKTNGSGQLSFGSLGPGDVPSLDAAKVTSGTLPIARGGTGLTSYGNNSVLISNGTGSALSSLNCAFGQVIKFDVSGFAGCDADNSGVASQWTTTGSDIYYSTGNVGIGTATPSAHLKLQVVGAAASKTNIIATGANVDLSLSNTQLLKAPGGSAITLSNMADGGSYTLVISDTTEQMYTFSGCTNSYFSPTNDLTVGQSSYSILVVVDGANTNCYINWVTGFN